MQRGDTENFLRSTLSSYFSNERTCLCVFHEVIALSSMSVMNEIVFLVVMTKIFLARLQ